MNEAEQFFYDHAGYSYPTGANEEIIDEHRRASARRLAEAEAWASDHVTWRWSHDDDADLSWHDDPSSVVEVLGCEALRPCGCCGHMQTVGSLWGIVDPDDDYRRVVEAEIALEAMP